MNEKAMLALCLVLKKCLKDSNLEKIQTNEKNVWKFVNKHAIYSHDYYGDIRFLKSKKKLYLPSYPFETIFLKMPFINNVISWKKKPNVLGFIFCIAKNINPSCTKVIILFRIRDTGNRYDPFPLTMCKIWLNIPAFFLSIMESVTLQLN